MTNTIKVLHVDDDEDIRTITGLAMSLDADIELKQCGSGAEALAEVANWRPDVLLLDMMMPGMNGEETWQRLKSDCGLAEVPAVFMSARAEESFAADLMKKGASAIITKPFDPMTLCTDLRSKLGL